MGFFSNLIDNWTGLTQSQAMQKQMAAYHAWQEWRAQMFSAGWMPWEQSPPPDGVELMLIRQEWDAPIFRKREDLSPMMNVNGLMWKPWTGRTIEPQCLAEK